ncbi:MAG: hypothetical protein AAB355_00055 [Patescibacteria group bacterium]
MKKLSASIGIGAISLLFAGIALAQTNATVPTAATKAAQVKEQAKEKLKRAAVKKPDTRPLEAAKKNAVEKRAQGLVTSSEKIIENTERQIVRAGELIARFEKKGANVTEAKKHVGLAKAKIAEAKTKLEEIKTAVKGISTATTPRDAIKAVQDKVAELRAIIREGHGHLVEAISSLRNAAGLRTNATTTPAQ